MSSWSDFVLMFCRQCFTKLFCYYCFNLKIDGNLYCDSDFDRAIDDIDRYIVVKRKEIRRWGKPNVPQPVPPVRPNPYGNKISIEQSSYQEVCQLHVLQSARLTLP